MSSPKSSSHVAVLTTSYPADNADPSGHFVASEVRRLVEAGERVSVLCAGPAPVTPTPSIEYVSLGGGSTFAWPGVGAQLKQAPWRAAHVLRFLWRAQRALRHGHYDRLVAHWLLPCAWPLAAAFRGPLEVVIHGSDARLFAVLPRRAQRHILDQLNTRQAALRFVASALLDCFAEHAHHPALQRARVEPCYLELEHVPPRDAARQALGLSPYVFLAVVVGRLIPEKRVHLALQMAAQHGRLFDAAQRIEQVPEAMLHSATSRATVVCVVVGDGPELSALERAFPAVRFVGKQPRTEALLWIRAADVLLNASQAEGAPSCVREARSLGTRVLSSPVGDVPRWASQDSGIELIQTWAP